MTKENLIKALSKCQEACNHCFDACLKEDDVKMMAECIRTDRDCADICDLVLSFAQRDSKLLPDLIETCIKSCESCADECEHHDHDHCQACAKACHTCAKACQDYIAQK